MHEQTTAAGEVGCEVRIAPGAATEMDAEPGLNACEFEDLFRPWFGRRSVDVESPREEQASDRQQCLEFVVHENRVFR